MNDDLVCLSREWKTQDCYDIARHLKFILEHIESIDYELAQLRTASYDLRKAANSALEDGQRFKLSETVRRELRAAIAKLD